jgi:hypothetical protein
MGSGASWFLASALCVGYLGFTLLDNRSDRRLFVPGTTSDGHYQIEIACNSCHGEAFADTSALQSACERCHASELSDARDSHPKSKFTDPRNADRTKLLDARRCVTCHREHWPEGTSAMGVTLPTDYCYHCHTDVARERPSHAGLEYSSCTSSGCHNFHDNRSLYEDFLVEHANEPDALPHRELRARAARPQAERIHRGQRDHTEIHLADSELEAWAVSAHANGGVNCSGCHQTDTGWSSAVPLENCARCHEREREGWGKGRHGMRVELGLRAMTPGDARAPMHEGVAHEKLGCTSCHGAHDFDVKRAAVQACQRCHSDPHTQAYDGSPHDLAWQAELSGQAAPNTGVSCATCHMPRAESAAGETFVEHNQNDNLRPREKMLRGVCSNCHGSSFSIDALADAELIVNNFRGPPKKHVASIDWAVTRSKAAPDVNMPPTNTGD